MTSPIHGIHGSDLPPSLLAGAGKVDDKERGSFGDMLTNMLSEVEKANVQADSAVQGLLTGESKDLHSVMIAVNKADISLRLALEVRNKLVEAYKQIMSQQF